MKLPCLLHSTSMSIMACQCRSLRLLMCVCDDCYVGRHVVSNDARLARLPLCLTTQTHQTRRVLFMGLDCLFHKSEMFYKRIDWQTGRQITFTKFTTSTNWKSTESTTKNCLKLKYIVQNVNHYGLRRHLLLLHRHNDITITCKTHYAVTLASVTDG